MHECMHQLSTCQSQLVVHQGRNNDHAKPTAAFASLRQLLRRHAVSRGDNAVTEGTVRGVEGGDGLPIVVLLADDTSEDQQVGMYVHSRFQNLCMGSAPMLRGMRPWVGFFRWTMPGWIFFADVASQVHVLSDCKECLMQRDASCVWATVLSTEPQSPRGCRRGYCPLRNLPSCAEICQRLKLCLGRTRSSAHRRYVRLFPHPI